MLQVHVNEIPLRKWYGSTAQLRAVERTLLGILFSPDTVFVTKMS